MRFRSNYLLFTLLMMLLSACSVQADDNIFGTKYYEGNRDMTWPVPDHYKLSGCFGDYRSHNAIDIPTGKNVPAVAAYGGTVKYTGWNGGYGNVVVIRHLYKLKNGKNIVLYTYYNHLQSYSVSAGDSVEAGDEIGIVGGTGGNYANHLDFQIKYMFNLNKTGSGSLDPYVNEFLELPDELKRGSTASCRCGKGGTDKCCCQQYLDRSKEIYADSPTGECEDTIPINVSGTEIIGKLVDKADSLTDIGDYMRKLKELTAQKSGVEHPEEQD